MIAGLRLHVTFLLLSFISNMAEVDESKALVKWRMIVNDTNYHQLSSTMIHMVKRPKNFVIFDYSSPAVAQAKSREQRVPSSFCIKT